MTGDEPAPPMADDFRQALQRRFRQAEQAGAAYVEIKAGDLHREVGGYPAPYGQHQMPVCRKIMRGLMGEDDEILSDPSTGQGSGLVIRYKIPRADHAAGTEDRAQTPR